MKHAIALLMIGIFACGAFAAKKSDMNWRWEMVPGEYDTMKMATYDVELAAALERERIARQGIAEEQARIESIRSRFGEIDDMIAQVIQEKYSILGITEQDVIDAENEIASIRQELELLLGLMPDELARRAGDIAKLQARIDALKAKPVSYLWRIRDQIRDLEDLMARVKANLPTNVMAMNYVVKLVPERRECLWRIAEYDFIYNDPAQWPKLYEGNRNLIDNYYNNYVRSTEEPKYSRSADLIRDGWELQVPR